MRAVCETCAAPQPVDWRPGDLCTQCGNAAREEVRCHWCARWNPKGNFCRKCGAVAVPVEQYGAARMLKHMGASVFEIPKLLAGFEPDLIATHLAIYSIHAAAAHRHIEDARWLGQFLYQKNWAQDVEEELTPQLPLDDATLARFQAAPPADPNPVKRAAAIAAHSPVLRLRAVADLVRIHLGDFGGLSSAAPLLDSDDAALAAEAALQLSGWRSLYTAHTGIPRHKLIGVLTQSPLPAHAAPRLAVLGAEPPIAPSPTGHPETDFLLVILQANTRALADALASPDPARRYVAAAQLIRLHKPEPVAPVLLAAGPDEQLNLLQEIGRAKRPVTALHPALFSLVANTPNPRIRKSAANAIALARSHPDFLRLLDFGSDDSDIIHAMLLAKPAPETCFAIGERLVREGRFRTSQWGWDAASKPGLMPVTFVPDLYPHAVAEVRIELLRFAEMQIEAHGADGTELERFLIRQCFAAAPPEVVGAAWASIHRIQMHRRVGLTVPCDLTLANVQWCWTMPELLEGIAYLMAHPAAVRQTFVRDDFSRFLRSAPPDFFVAAAQNPDACARVSAAAQLTDPFVGAPRFAAQLTLKP
jgi:hypothetical protein